MGFFDSESTVNNQTTNNVENKHATAGADGFAVGAGSNVHIENVSDDIALASLDLADDSNARLAGFGSDAIETLASTTARQTGDFLSFADRFQREQNDTVEQQLDRHNEFAKHTTELIAAQAGVTAPSDGKGNQKLVAGALVLVGLFVLIPSLLKTGKAVK